MRQFLRSIVLVALIALPVTAHAQIREIQGTPRATVQGVQIGTWADQYGQGLSGIFVTEKLPQGWSGGIYTMPGSTTLMADIQAAGGVIPFIEAHRPAMNAALAVRFPAAGAPPTPTGDQGADAINLALQSGYKFTVSANGQTVTLDPK